MNEIAITHVCPLASIRFVDDDTQFVLDWIIANGKEKELGEYLNDTKKFGYLRTYETETDDLPEWTEKALERLLRGYDPDSGDPFLGNFILRPYNEELLKKLNVPTPSAFQMYRHVMPSGYKRGDGTYMRSTTMRPLDTEDIEKTMIYHLGKGVISIDVQSSFKPDAE